MLVHSWFNVALVNKPGTAPTSITSHINLDLDLLSCHRSTSRQPSVNTLHTPRITELTPRDFGVTVTTRSAQVGADQYWEETRFGKDVYYQVVTEEEREERLRAQSKVKKRGVTARSIKNPHYVDATPADVVERLRDRQDGDFLFSPEV